MSTSSSSSSLQNLFAAARNDAPSSTVHDAVWGRVAASTIATAAATTGTVAGVAMASKATASAKLLTIGAVIGAASAALTAFVVTSSDPSSTPISPNAQRRVPAIVVTGHAAGAQLADPAPRLRASQTNLMELPANAAVAATSQPPADEASALAEEARLVTEARSALLRGEPERTLTLVRSTRRLPSRVLEPEEMVLEARALRALGRADEALATELTLRRRFPSHTLSR